MELLEGELSDKLSEELLSSVLSFKITNYPYLQRIDNWATLTEHEKEVTWRRIRKRNAERREALEAKQKEQEALENES